MLRRSLWLLLALVLGFGVPFFAIGIQTGTCSEMNDFVECSMAPAIGWPAAILLSIAGLVAAAWAVRQSRPSR